MQLFRSSIEITTSYVRDLRSRSEGPFFRLWFSGTCFGLVSPEKSSQTKELKDLLAFFLVTNEVGSAGATGHSIFFERHLISLMIYSFFMID